MGQQSLEQINIENYLLEWNEELMSQADLYYLNKHFKIGEEYSEKEVEFYQLYMESLYNPSCELSDWIWKKINGFFEDIDCQAQELNSMKYQPVQNITNVFNEGCEWEATSW